MKRWLLAGLPFLFYCWTLPVGVLPIGVLPDAALHLHREDCQGQKQFFALRKELRYVEKFVILQSSR